MRRESLQRKKGIEIVGNKVCWIIHGCYTFYECSGRYYHDRDCLEVKQIALERFAAPEEIRDVILRKASDDFDWSEISHTIFGTVFESTLNLETRRAGGMHYTSIENIHKAD